jgi:tetratricopeptide (TPR) repeat protein
MLPPILHALLLSAAPLTGALPDSVPLYTDLGSHHHAISSQVPRTQQYFDQGIRLVFGFNHGEAIRAFREAARLDSTCAICYWGAALAYGPHVNAPMDSAGGVEAYALLQQAIALAPRASRAEQAYIRALTARYAATPPANRSGLDSAYALAMADVVREYPQDLDAATLYAEALMDLRPWNYWKKDRSPYPGTEIIVAQLERVIAANPNHPGACHYYIHAVEAVSPEKAVPCAERLAALMPGAGHMVHMPAHIYIRVGRYNDAIMANQHAVHADESYIAAEHPSGIYPVGYYPHNYHFLAFASMMSGRSADAIQAAKGLVASVPADVARAVPPMEAMLPYLDLTLVTFGRWDEVLSQPLPPADLRMSTALAQYARGVAFAATARWPEAQTALDSVRQIASGTNPADQTAMSAGEGENKTVVDIATHALMGEIAYRQGKFPDAVAHFTKAVELEDTFNYVEPPQWYYPVRQSLGAALLKAGNPAQAEAVYREDLRRFPENGWDLYGLSLSLKQQGKTGDATAVDARLARAWAQSDVKLLSSRF